MTLTVSIGKFRQNIADYIAKAKEGHIIVLKDEKKGQEIGQLVGKKTFNPQTFENAIHNVSGIFSAKKHPEWKTKHDVIKWVKQGRQIADRNF